MTKEKVNWDNAERYVDGVCKEAGVWWKSKSSKALDDFNKAKVLKPDTTSSSANVVKELIKDGYIGWAIFFSCETLTSADLKKQVDFILEQVPKKLPLESEHIRVLLDEIDSCVLSFNSNPRPSVVAKLLSLVVSLDCYVSNKDKSDTIQLKVLNNSIKLMEEAS
jgi:hypothetical protein